jgi:hypothetical protein
MVLDGNGERCYEMGGRGVHYWQGLCLSIVFVQRCFIPSYSSAFEQINGTVDMSTSQNVRLFSALEIP